MKQTSGIQKQKVSKFVAIPLLIGSEKKKKDNNERAFKNKTK